MPVSDTQLWTTIGFTALLAVAAILSVGAYWSLRRMDDVVLRARMYMNRRRLFGGFLSLAFGMIAILTIALLQLGYIFLAGETSPAAVSTVGLAVSFGLLTWGFYNFYALSKAPKASEASGGS